MKKIVFLFLALAGMAFGAELTGEDQIKIYSIIGAGFALGVSALGAALGMGNTAAATVNSIARNPGIAGKITTTMFIALAMIEALVIYALVVTFIVLYANPLI